MSIIKQSIKSSIYNYIGILLGAFFTLYLTPRFLTTEYNGLYRLLLEYAGIIATYTHFGIPLIINKYYHRIITETEHHKGFHFFIFGIPIIGFVIIALLFLLFKEPITRLIASETDYKLVLQYILFMIPIFLCNSYLLIQRAYTAMLGDIIFVSFIQNVFYKFFNILAVIVFIFTGNFQLSMWVIVISYILGVIAIQLKINTLSLAKISLVPSWEFIKKNRLARDFFKFFIFIILSNLSTFFITKIDLFFVAKYTDLSNIAFYTTASYFVLFLMVPYNSVLAISFPEIVKLYTLKEKEQLSAMIKGNGMFGLILSIYCFLIIWFNIDFIYNIIPNGELYEKGKYVFLILAIGKLIDISIGSLGQLIVASEWYNYTLLFSIVTSVVGIVLGYYMTSYYGIIGSALAITITTIVSDIFQVLLGYLRLKTTPFDNNIIKILVLTSFLILCCFIFKSINMNQYITFIIKTLFITIIFFGGIYLFNINEETNKLLLKVFRRIRR
jgi:hypothetical protein